MFYQILQIIALAQPAIKNNFGNIFGTVKMEEIIKFKFFKKAFTLYKFRKHYLTGFTLIELLVVVVIIAILAVVVFLSYSGAQSKARDTRRISDITTIKGALTMFNQDYNRFPRPHTNWESFDYFDGGTWAGTTDWDGVLYSDFSQDSGRLAVYYPTPLKDPKTNSYYYWTMSNTPTDTKWQDYTLLVALENQNYGSALGSGITSGQIVAHQSTINLSGLNVCRTGVNMGDVVNGVNTSSGTVLTLTQLPICSGL